VAIFGDFCAAYSENRNYSPRTLRKPSRAALNCCHQADALIELESGVLCVLGGWSANRTLLSSADSDHVLIEPLPPELAGVLGLSLSRRATVGRYLPVYPVATIDVRWPT
jgi:hypothetical protein